MISQNFAALAATLPLLGFASYTRDTLRGRARPNPVSWSLWAAAPMIAFVAELATGTSVRVALVTFALGAGPAMVVLASLARHRPGPGHRAPLPRGPAPPAPPGGAGRHWRLTRFDYACGASGALALALWAITGHGDIAIAFAIAAEFFAATPTIIKSWFHPESETVGTYAASGGGGGITLMTIAHWRFSGYAFPLAVTAECALIIGLITLRPLVPGRGRPATARTQNARATAAGAAAMLMTAVLAFVLYRIATALYASDPTGIAPVQERAVTRLPSPTAFQHRRPDRRPRVTRSSSAALPRIASRPAPSPSPSHPAPSRRASPSPARTPRPSPTRSTSPHPSSPGPTPSRSPAPSPSPSPSPSPTPSPTPYPSIPSPTPYPSTPSPGSTPSSSSPSPSPSPSAIYPSPSATHPPPTATVSSSPSGTAVG